MTNKKTIQLKKYLTKLRETIEHPTFSFMDKRYVKKVRIDDLICCIEASFPECFKNLLNTRKLSSVESGKLYKNLLIILKGKKSIIFSDCYLISYRAAISLIEAFSRSIDSDIKKILDSTESMY